MRKPRVLKVEKLLSQLSDHLRPFGIHQVTLDLEGNNPPAVALEDDQHMGIGDDFSEAFSRLTQSRIKQAARSN